MPGLEGSPEMLANCTPSNPGLLFHWTCSGVTTGKGWLPSARMTPAGPRSTTPASATTTERALMLSSVFGKRRESTAAPAPASRRARHAVSGAEESRQVKDVPNPLESTRPRVQPHGLPRHLPTNPETAGGE